MRVLYFDCFSGAAGDMILGALLDAGASEPEVRSALARIGLPGWELEVTTTDRGGFRASRAQFHIEDANLTRSYPEVAAILQASSLAPEVRQKALEAFSLIAEAEARVHGVTRDEAHFHEVGADDAILDVVGALAALENLGAEQVVTSPIATGVTGLAPTSHGLIPVPAPATAELLSTAGATMFTRGTEELVTPTGAAILATVSQRYGDMPPLRLERVGYGAGARELPHPNFLRVMIGVTFDQRSSDALLLEANLDDISPELMPHVVDALLAAGAHDAWITPAVMKKGRPGFVLSVLGPHSHRDALIDIVFAETSTLGLRTLSVSREVLDRDWIRVDVEGFPVRVKLGLRDGRVWTTAPEHDDAAEVARATSLPLKEVYARALAAVEEASSTRPAPPSP